MTAFTTSQTMADAKFFDSYSRYREDLGRYETWSESVDRVMNMHRGYFKDKGLDVEKYIKEVEPLYKSKRVFGAQRALQFGGEQLLKNNGKLYNCTASYADRLRFFGETAWWLLCGAGVGFSVQKHHIEQMPVFKERTKDTRTFVIEDSIEGWADAWQVLIDSFTDSEQAKFKEYSGHPIRFDYSLIRPKDAEISGGFKAPGYEPLQKSIGMIELRLQKVVNRKLESIEAYDIVMIMGDAIISAGIRRAALLCLFSKDDELMLKSKSGDWFYEHPYRARSNNSMLLIRSETTHEQIAEYMNTIKEFGEPAFIFSDNNQALFNPCVEIGMYPKDLHGNSGFQACNLSEINGKAIENKSQFFECCRAASIIGTLQAAYTKFPYLDEVSKNIIEHEALIGVSITGWMNSPDILFDEETLKQGAKIVKDTNEEVAKFIGIKKAARTTTCKPSGNTSVIMGSSSGIHGEHSKTYIRHVQMPKSSDIAKLIKKCNPAMIEQSIYNQNDYVISFPITPKEGSIYKKDLLGVKQLEYVKFAQQFWVEEGTNPELCTLPNLKHNVSNTIVVDDWDKVTDYISENKDYFCGISFMPMTGDDAYAQAPFTEIYDHETIVSKFGVGSMFASGLIVSILDDKIFGDLWSACSCAKFDSLEAETECNAQELMLKKDWIRRYKKFAKNYFNSDLDKCELCLKAVYNLHKYTKIKNNYSEIDFSSLPKKEFTDIGELVGAACAGGACEINF